VITAAELKINKIPGSGGDHLGIKYESSSASLVRSDDDRDISSEGRDNTSEDSEGSSNKLHV
jgi:hypothetical protein